MKLVAVVAVGLLLIVAFVAVAGSDLYGKVVIVEPGRDDRDLSVPVPATAPAICASGGNGKRLPERSAGKLTEFRGLPLPDAGPVQHVTVEIFMPSAWLIGENEAVAGSPGTTNCRLSGGGGGIFDAYMPDKSSNLARVRAADGQILEVLVGTAPASVENFAAHVQVLADEATWFDYPLFSGSFGPMMEYSAEAYGASILYALEPLSLSDDHAPQLFSVRVEFVEGSSVIYHWRLDRSSD